MRFIQRRGPFQTKRHGDYRRRAAWLNAKWVKGCVTTQLLPMGIISLQPPETEDAGLSCSTLAFLVDTLFQWQRL